MEILYFIILCALTLMYTFYMGFNDGANAVATTVATRAIKPRTAIVIAAITMIASPIVAYFTLDFAVADTISKSIIMPDALLSITGEKGFLFLFSALTAAIIWGIVSKIFNLPSSTSHLLMGGIIGSAIVAVGFSKMFWDTILLKIFLMAIIAPFIGIGISFLLMKIMKKLSYYLPIQYKTVFNIFQVLNLVLLAATISINNVQKMLGVVMLIISLCPIPNLPNELLLYSAIAFAILLALGIIFGGYRLINSVGSKIYKIGSSHSIVAQLSTALIVFASTSFGIPVSTGQIVTSTIMGVGAADRVSAVRWNRAKTIFTSWYVTLPIVCAIGAITYALISLIMFGGII